ncbi:MAG: 2'-5' RNA ligase [Acidobacteria bacterium RIFCSPLOWO2_12_FULL_67_14]|nr:MAG: 2'-5' RNA ligase [Acidobacteria bacterium RIFCSPLOWO2_02_FULL_67_21]OFW35660.1 MAG: 2'-5' RNA ligase [Acidobacteria bacterium RIFCSPLOWO2_12_FULL_67_14]
MRLFVAVELEPRVAAQIAECSRELRRRAEAMAPRARVSWVPPERLHVTVRFIGQADETRVTAIGSALEPALTTRRFDIVAAGMGAFPERGRPRVLWAGVTGGQDALGNLAREVSGRLESCGVARDERPFRPHVTLARIRDPGGLRSGPLLAGLVDQVFGSSPVDAITLFESRPSSSGHVDVPLRRTRLG